VLVFDYDNDNDDDIFGDLTEICRLRVSRKAGPAERPGSAMLPQ
jgi:hypothetical protein